jgi:hypothetical protein
MTLIHSSYSIENDLDLAVAPPTRNYPERLIQVVKPRHKLELTLTTEGVEALKRLCDGQRDAEGLELADRLRSALP